MRNVRFEKVKQQRGLLLRGVCLAGFALALTGGAYAQDESTDFSDDEEIVVTGARAPRPDYAYSNPVVSFDAQAIEYSGAVNLTDALTDLPALVASNDSNDSSGSNAFIGGTGLNLLNLRNLGVDRTLVLVNGRRHVATLPGSAAVDVNTIPIGLIKRVEVLTGGASAIYGADGVSGVVNFVMDDRFEGLSLRAQAGTPEDPGADSQFLSMIAGTNFANNRGNFALAVEYTHEDSLSAFDRDFAGGGARRLFVENPFDPGDDPNIPDNIPLGDIRFFDSAIGGWVDATFDGAPDFHGSGRPWNPGTIPFISPFYAQGGDGTPLDTYIGDLLGEQDRFVANFLGHYDVTNNLRFFTELKYVNTQSLSYAQPTFDFFLFQEIDNPFMPQAIRDAVINSGAGVALVSRDHFDLGVRSEDITRETFRSVVGFEGDLTENIAYNVSWTYGETDVENHIGNNRFQDRFAAAIDVVIDPSTGRPTCRVNLDPNWSAANSQPFNGFAEPTTFTPGPNSGCVPLNLFGENAASPAAISWIMQDSFATSKITQNVATAYLSGTLDSLFTLPGGSVGFAAGGEWRRETSESHPAPEDTAGVTFGNVIFPDSGVIEVKEAFVELSLPLLSELPFVHEFAIDAAARYSDYSTIGETTTWKLGAVWSPIRDITFRGTLAEAVRAPNIGELFDPGGQTFRDIDDPCDISNVNNGTSTRAANCAAILNALGINPATYTDPNSAFVPGTLRGNRALQEETAETTTFGVILRPRFLDRLTVSVDYYDISIENAINTASAQELADNCVDAPTINNQFCAVLVRDPLTGGISDFTQQPFNVASFTTEGYDFSIAYTVDPQEWGATQDWGVFNLRLIGNKLEDLTFINLPNAEPDPDLGEGDPNTAPEWQVNFDLVWDRGPLTVAYGLNYFSETQRFNLQARAGDPDIAAPQYLDFDAKFTQDIQARWRWNDRFTIYGGVNNFTNEEPDIGELFYPVSAVGRFYYLGFTTRLPSLYRPGA